MTWVFGAGAEPLPAERAKEIPEPLKVWEGWATWGDQTLGCPTPSHDPAKALCFWPSRLELEVEPAGGRFRIGVTVFREAWVPLPGGAEAWPREVTADGTVLPVVEHKGVPSVKLGAGRHDLRGIYQWSEVPQRIAVPAEVGILALTLDGQVVEAPVWDAKGFLWLKRDASTEQVDKDFLGIKLDSLLEDGIPLRLRSELELVVAGKSREEEIGVVLPQGWKLAAVESPVPVAVDAAGRLKAQVRAGKWVVKIDAFRLDHPAEIAYAADAKRAVEGQLVGFQARPEFRLAEITGLPQVDVSQTPFPDAWREFPVYRWDTGTGFRLEERMRGMGLQKPEGLQIAREWWLDEDGRGLTFRDRITGHMQQVWRIDAAEGQDLGSVRAGGEGQLITRNPENGAAGVEIRRREIELEATGRMARDSRVSATGWRSDADGVNVSLNLPPGWRLFALFGADWVSGDWLTAWTLLDLFLLLIFTLAVFRLWGWKAAALAFCAFGLAYHEPTAPRYTWLALLLPLALLRVVPAGWGRRVLLAWKWVTVAVLVLTLVPFVARQVQQSLYPQLENPGGHRWLGQTEYNFASPASMARQSALLASEVARGSSDTWYGEQAKQGAGADTKSNANLAYDAKARIQTGPGVPTWSWRTATFGWNGPVQASQQVRPVLIPQGVERVLSLLRVLLLIALAGVLLQARRAGGIMFRRGGGTSAALVALLCLAGVTRAPAQLPDKETLETLRARLLEKPDAYPTAADIPLVSLALQDRKITLEAEVHAAILTAVPLPGRLPAWSPLRVNVDGQPEAVVRRDDGFLWVVLPAGVHRVRVEGTLLDLTEWEWSFRLKPRRVTVDAAGWNVSGLRPDGTPEAQVFFSRKQQAGAGEASYDRPDVQTAAVVDRHLELGLEWQVRTTVSRLTPDGKALELRIPLLPGENVISSNMVVKEGAIEVRLGARDASFAWEGKLSPAEGLRLASKRDDAWIERWHLVASPVWNVSVAGLAPVFEAANPELVPVWHPWPGEAVDLTIHRPEAAEGATVTIGEAKHEMMLGKRQRSATLELSLRCSLGEDFLVALPAGVDATSLTHNDKAIPVRKDGDKLVVPLQPGEQRVVIGWKDPVALGFEARAGEVRLPVESANIDTTIHVPDDRWVLWANGPLRGPAVRFWGILLCSLLAAWVLGHLAHSPLRPAEWMLLALGLTQVPLPAALVVVGWLFFLAWRGRDSFSRLPAWVHNLLQVFLIVLSLVTLGVFIAIVAAGLLGDPEMFIRGNGSTRTVLRWYEARSGGGLPRPGCWSVSIWWYRLLMLLWALWLAASLIRWLRWAWQQFSSGACFRRMAGPKPAGPPPLAPQG